MPRPHCAVPAAGGRRHLHRPAAPAAREPATVPVHCRRGRRSAVCRGPAAMRPQRFVPGPRGPVGDHHPAPARPGSARAHHCRRPRSAGRWQARGHLRPAAVRSAAHPRTSRPMACAAAPAARTPPAPRPAPSATPGARGVPAATTNGLRGGRGPAQDVQRHAGDAGARVPCVQGSRGSVKLSRGDAPRSRPAARPACPAGSTAGRSRSPSDAGAGGHGHCCVRCHCGCRAHRRLPGRSGW